MDKKKLTLVLFSVLSMIIVAVPICLIIQQEDVIATGREFKFKTEPIDPFDAFRGRYVALGFGSTKLKKPADLDPERGQSVYVLLENGPDGFAVFSGLSKAAPRSVPYLKCRVSWVYKDDVHFRMPIDKYFLSESKAPKAERLYRRHNARDSQDGYVLVAVKNGNAVIKGLYLGGKPIEQLLKQEK